MTYYAPVLTGDTNTSSPKLIIITRTLNRRLTVATRSRAPEGSPMLLFVFVVIFYFVAFRIIGAFTVLDWMGFFAHFFFLV